MNPAVSTWNGTVAIDDSALSSSVTSLARQVGENVGVRTITAGMVTAASGNYSAPTLVTGSTLTIRPAPLTATWRTRPKSTGRRSGARGHRGDVEGARRNPAVVTWNGNVAIDDSALTSTATRLARQAGENVGTSRYHHDGQVHHALDNYSAPTW